MIRTVGVCDFQTTCCISSLHLCCSSVWIPHKGHLLGVSSHTLHGSSSILQRFCPGWTCLLCCLREWTSRRESVENSMCRVCSRDHSVKKSGRTEFSMTLVEAQKWHSVRNLVSETAKKETFIISSISSSSETACMCNSPFV